MSAEKNSDFPASEEIKDIIEKFVETFGMEKKILSGDLAEKIKVTVYPVADIGYFFVIDYEDESIGTIFDNIDSCYITSYYGDKNYGEILRH